MTSGDVPDHPFRLRTVHLADGRPDPHPGAVDDDALIASWGRFSDAYLAVVLRLSEGIEAAGQLTLPQFDILLRLLRAPGHMLPLDRIATETGLSAAGLVKLVNRMELDGVLVCESTGPGSGALAATITDHGSDLTRAALGRHVDDLRRHLLAPLGADGLRDLDTLTRALSGHDS